MEKSEEKIINQLTSEFNLRSEQVTNTVKLIDDGNTIPFIARYRKEATGSLSDEILRDFYDRLSYLRNLEDKKEEIINKNILNKYRIPGEHTGYIPYSKACEARKYVLESLLELDLFLELELLLELDSIVLSDFDCVIFSEVLFLL